METRIATVRTPIRTDTMVELSEYSVLIREDWRDPPESGTRKLL